MKNIQVEVDKLYYKLAIINRKHKNTFVNSNPKDCSLNLNGLICKENTSSIEVVIEQIYQKFLDSKPGLVCLYNFEMLFRPEYRFDLLSYMKEKSKTKTMAIIWPGEIQKDHLIYSRPGRSDYYTHKIDNYHIYKEEE